MRTTVQELAQMLNISKVRIRLDSQTARSKEPGTDEAGMGGSAGDQAKPANLEHGNGQGGSA